MAKILVVDDDSLVVRATVRILASAGYEVATANNGAHGLLVLDSSALPACIVLDVDMPTLSGPEMVDAMVKHDHGQEDIPILLVSGRSDLPDIAARIGTPYYLSKGLPGYPSLLLETLRRALAGKVTPAKHLAPA